MTSLDQVIAGILDKAVETVERLRSETTPRYVSWSVANRSQLIRIPAVSEVIIQRYEGLNQPI